MSDFRIDFEWIDPASARGDELRATWARLAMFVDGHPLTRVFDKRSRTVRDAVYLPLYPLAEWLAERWWSLWAEPSSTRAGFGRRHSLVYAREGYALPSVEFIPEGPVILVSWRPETLPAHGVEFTEGGETWIETSSLKERVGSFIETVVARLSERGILDSPLQEEWAAIQSADPEEAMFCESVGALGLDPYDLGDVQRDIIEGVGNRLPREVVAEFFRAARSDMDTLLADAKEVLDAIASAGANPANFASLRDFAESSRPEELASPNPWEQGYLYARRLRAHFGLDGSPLRSVGEVGEALGLDGNEFERSLGRFSNRRIPFAALAGINDRFDPSFVLRPARLEVSTKFHLCRALFEYISAPNRRASLVTDLNTVQQKRNRAFAAELLAPASALRARVASADVTTDMAEELADEFGVSVYVIQHQLENHRIAGIIHTI